jgi:hypothetical protein
MARGAGSATFPTRNLVLAAEDEASTAIGVVFERFAPAPDFDQPAGRYDGSIESTWLGTAQ